MRGRSVFASCAVVLACGARSTLDVLAPPSDDATTTDAMSPASDVADAPPDVSLCTYAAAPCDAGIVEPCDGCAPPTVLASCQSLPQALALDDASVVWINQGV